jgi:tetratricopeptide (TPR) repeat protein/4-amino-4-deoxy-L-arabinose transferase-like glycosyltransferase
MIPLSVRRLLQGYGWVYTLLSLILLVSAYLRWLPLDPISLESIIVGDAKEYRLLAEFFLDQSSSLPPDRYPGFPFLLASLFTILPFDHDVIQIASSVGLSVLVIALSFFLASRLLGPATALLVATLTAVQPQLIYQAHRGLSDELYIVCLLLLLILFQHVRTSSAIGWGSYLLLGISCAAVALVRPDGAYVSIPIFLTFVWRDRREGLIRLIRTTPIVAIPLSLPVFVGMWTDAHGIQDMSMRLGRIILWMEFMLGRMPYSYTFYKETHVNEWLLQYHDLSELFTLGLKSSVRNFLSLGQGIWGQVPLLVSLVGIFRYARQERDWVLPLAIPLAVLPQWGIVALWMEADVERYNMRTVPLLLIFLAFGSRQLTEWIRCRHELNENTARWMPAAIVVLCLAPVLAPFSLSSSIRPTVDILMTERLNLTKTRDEIHPSLVSIWGRAGSSDLSLPKAIAEVEGLRDSYYGYAPTHFVLGVFYMSEGQTSAAIEALEHAVEVVPFFAEAAVLLAELYIMEDRRQDALLLMERTAVLRDEYPLIALLAGHLHAMAGDHDKALVAYQDYLRLTHYQHDRAFVRALRITKRNGADTSGLEQMRHSLETAGAGLTSSFLWNYLSLDLDGIHLAPPQDGNLYYNMGVASLLGGDTEAALRYLTTMVQIAPADASAWANLGTLYAAQENYTQARASWVRALDADPDQVVATEGLRLLDSESFTPTVADRIGYQFVMPLTSARLQ